VNITGPVTKIVTDRLGYFLINSNGYSRSVTDQIGWIGHFLREAEKLGYMGAYHNLAKIRQNPNSAPKTPT